MDTYPEFLPPTVQIRTEALGLSAAEVEQLITVPLEQDLLNGVPWLDQIRSESMTGLSSVELVFEPGTDLLKARQMVQERLTQVAGLPNVGSRPSMVQPVSSTSRVMMISLSSKTLSLIDLSVLAHWKIRSRLMGIPGVANVAVWGQRDRQLQVQVDPDRLLAHGISLNQVIDTTGNALWSSPLTFVEASTPGTGGFIDTRNQRFGVQHMMPITTPKGLASVTIEDASGKRLRLGNVARVVDDHQPLIGDALGKHGPSLMLVIQKFPGADTLQVTRDVEQAMTALAPGLAGVQVDTRVFRPATFVQSSLHNVGLSGLVALGLVLLVIIAFTRSWRTTLIMSVAIPVSLVSAAWVLYLRGSPFNSLTLAGLMVALGVVIDDAVTDTLSIRARLAQGRAADDSSSTAEAVVEGSHQVRRPLLYATLALLLILLPLAVHKGVPGAFSRELAVSYALAVLASMLVALTLTPALSITLPPASGSAQDRSLLVRAARRLHDHIAPRYIRRPGASYATVALLAVAGMAVLPQLGAGPHLVPPKDRDLLVELQAVPGTSLREMDRISTAMDHEVAAVPGVADVGVHVGRAITSDQVADVDSAEMWLSIAPSADYASTMREVRRVLSRYPGLRHHLTTYEQEQLALSDSRTRRPLVVRVFGQDLQTLRAQAEMVRRTMAAVAGVRAPHVEWQPEEPTLQVMVNLPAAERHGIRPGDVRRTAATLLSGLLVGNLYEQQKVFDVVVWGAPSLRENLSTVENLMIDTPSGGHVRLRDVATVRMAPAPRVIDHEDVSRYVDVTADVSGRTVGAIRADVAARVHALRYPLEYHAEVLGNASTRQGVDGRVLGLGLGALVGIFLLLQALTGSWRAATLLFLLVPLGVTGGVLVAPLVGGIMSAGALMGLLAVLGVTARNAMLLVHQVQRRAAEGESHDPALVLDTTRRMLVPVLLTASALAVAMIPFVVVGEVAGQELLHPLAVVVLGGLVTSTLLTLFVIPALYSRFLVSAPPDPLALRSPRRPQAEEIEGTQP